MTFKKVKNISILTELFFIFFPICVFSQSQESGQFSKADIAHQGNYAYQRIDSLSEKQNRIVAFKSFILTYPDNPNKTNALMELFSIYLNDSKVKIALNYADQAVQFAPGQLKIGILDAIAYSLAHKKVGLDTAAVYTNRAVSESKKTHSNLLKYGGMALDTKALIMFDLGQADSALALEKEAITVDRDNPDFLSHLATYQEAAGFRLLAIKTAATAILYGNTNEAVTNFNKWIEKERFSKKDQDKLRQVIGDSTLKLFFDKSKMEDKYRINSTAAAFLALIRTNLKQANEWIQESKNTLNDNSAIKDRVLITKNYGLVLFAEGKVKEAFSIFDAIERLAEPLDANFWYTVGKSYEKAHAYQKALDSYTNGLISFRFLSLQSALRKLSANENISQNKIESVITQKYNDNSSFEPGHYKGNNTKGNVILAELFTGADDQMSVSADFAFDYLSKYFTRNEVAILEYHQHIPSPDPMTNPNGFSRYLYYDKTAHMGVPTAIIEGTSRIYGGGSKEFTKNKFDEYKYSLEKFLSRHSDIKVNGFVNKVNDSISVNLQIDKEFDLPSGTSLHIALAEKTIDYSGGNEIKKHIFVVRNLFKGPAGTFLKSDKGTETVSVNFNLDEIEKGLDAYLTNPTKDPSWTITVLIHWKKWLGKLDHNNLAVVAWIQNDKSKEVLQAKYFDVPANNLEEGNK